MLIKFTKRFIKQYNKSDTKIQLAFKNKLTLFKQNPFDQQLNNHSLTGKLKGYRSINITGDWRVIYSETKNIVIFEMIGTHSQLYK